MYLTQLLHRALQQRPDATMTVYGDRRRTVREVVDRVARLAGALQSFGVDEGDRVALLARNTDRYHETFFACWWAGAAINPVNIRWSAAEIAYSLADSGARIVLVDDAFLDIVDELRQRCPQPITFVYCGDGRAPGDLPDYEQLIASTPPVEDRRRGGEALAALLYTGGTTGFPKGVMSTHQGLLTSMLGTEVVARAVTAGGVALVAAPMFHIAGIVGWLAQNCVGGTSVFLPAFDPPAVLQAIEEQRITSIALVPTMLQLVIDHPRRAEFDLGSVQAVGYGASPISPTVLERAIEAFPQARFNQGYGMTETAMISELAACDHTVGNPRLRSAGRATPHCEVKIVDPFGVELPRGEVGEILARGDAVTPGYWNKPDETAQALRDGWMHTGDAAYMDDEGYLFIVDRVKDMIVSGAENVYSTEVELALATHPAVAMSAVVGRPDPRWGERVHAVIVLKPGARTSAEELRAHCKTLIAGYKAPRSVEFVDALPMSAAGKILKRELRG